MFGLQSDRRRIQDTSEPSRSDISQIDIEGQRRRGFSDTHYRVHIFIHGKFLLLRIFRRAMMWWRARTSHAINLCIMFCILFRTVVMYIRAFFTRTALSKYCEYKFDMLGDDLSMYVCTQETCISIQSDCANVYLNYYIGFFTFLPHVMMTSSQVGKILHFAISRVLRDKSWYHSEIYLCTLKVITASPPVMPD